LSNDKENTTENQSDALGFNSRIVATPLQKDLPFIISTQKIILENPNKNIIRKAGRHRLN
jgi:hypothetical protein